MWDIEQIKNKIILRESKGNILLRILFCPISKTASINANLKGLTKEIIRISDNGVFIGRVPILSNCTVFSCRKGLVVTDRDIPVSGCVEGRGLSVSNLTVGGYPIGFKNVEETNNTIVASCEIAFFFDRKFLDEVSDRKRIARNR